MIMKKSLTLVIEILFIINNALANDDIPFAAAIIGGEAIESWNPTTPRHQVTILLGHDNENGTDFCGGSILDERHILTAAHCVLVETGAKPGPFFVIAGAIRVVHPTTETPRVRRIYVPRVLNGSCEAYVPEEDVAVLELDRDFNFDKNPHLRKVELPVPVPGGTYDTYENKTAVIAGFGAVDTGVNMHDNFEFKTSTIVYPDKMQVAKVDILSQEECRKAWIQEMKIQPCQMCGRVQGQSFRGVCKGDKGNGLIYENKIIGVLSYGNKLCYEGRTVSMGQPAVYSRITSFLPFIQGVLNDNIVSNDTCSFAVSHSRASGSKKFSIFLTVIIMITILDIF